MAQINYRLRHNKRELLRASALTVVLTLITFLAHADGLTATGNTLPIGANGTTVLTITGGANPSATFSAPVSVTGAVSVNGTVSSTGVVNAPAGINVNSNGVLYPNGNTYFAGPIGIGTTHPVDTGVGAAPAILGIPNAKVLDVYGDIVTDTGHIVSNYNGNSTIAGSLALDAGPWNQSVNPATGIYFRSTNVLGKPGYTEGYKDLMFVRGDGNVGIGTTSPQATIDVAGTANISGALTIASTGSVTSPIYYHTSDARLKTDIRPIGNALDKLLSIKGVTFEWKNNGRQDMGVVAQNVAEVFPDVVHKDDKGMMAVEYDSLVGPMIEAIRELKVQNDALNTKIRTVDELKKENVALKETEIKAVHKNDMLEAEIKEIRAEMKQMKQHTTDISVPAAVLPSDVIEH